MMEVKDCSYCKTFSNRTRIHKSTSKNQKPRTPCFTIDQGIHRKTIKSIKVLRDAGIFKGITIAHNSRCLLVRHGGVY